jgi:dethiobiotin synthetase
MRKIFVTGIGTDVGKTVVSSILVEALKADYWKPIQTGSFYGTDTEKVKRLVSNDVSQFHKETYILEKYISPHAAAEQEGIEIDINNIVIPETTNQTLIIEGAGGIMVPINNKHFIIDLIQKLNCEVVLVGQNYLGSINHTLLSLEALKNRGLSITAKIFNGAKQESSEDIILHHYPIGRVEHINKEVQITKDVILKYAEHFKSI